MTGCLARAALVLAMVAGAARCDAGSTDDCRDDDRSCFGPYVCRNVDGTYSCGSAAGDVPPCRGTPAGQIVPFSFVPGTDIPQHWTLGTGCVPVTYTASLAVRLADIQAAVDAWDDIPCSRLCFGAPTPNEADPDIARAERRLHFKIGDVTLRAGMVVSAAYEHSTGRIMNAKVEFHPDAVSMMTGTRLVQAVGLLIGLSPPAARADSVLTNGGVVPTALDEAAVCTLYGDPSFCGD